MTLHVHKRAKASSMIVYYPVVSLFIWIYTAEYDTTDFEVNSEAVIILKQIPLIVIADYSTEIRRW